MKRRIVIILLIVTLVCSCYWVYAQEGSIQSSGSVIQDSTDLPDLNPSPEPSAIDPKLVNEIDIKLTDGRVFHFIVPPEQFDTATISHLIAFIRTSDADSTTFTLSD